MLIEQAFYGSAQTSRGAGYQWLARSRGFAESTAAELLEWAPSHDSLCQDCTESTSLIPLKDKSFAIGITTLDEQEYSQRGGRATRTHFLIVDAKILAKFANNPFALVNAVTAQGVNAKDIAENSELPQVRLCGRAAMVDHALTNYLISTYSTAWIRVMLGGAIAGGPVYFAGLDRPAKALAGLLNFMPPAVRNQISFTTGLKDSPRRPFQLGVVSKDPVEKRRVARLRGATMIDLTLAHPPAPSRGDGWGWFVASAIDAGATSYLFAEVALERPNLTLAALNVLGQKLHDSIGTRSHSAVAEDALARPSHEAAPSRPAASQWSIRKDTPPPSRDAERKSSGLGLAGKSGSNNSLPATSRFDHLTGLPSDTSPADILIPKCPTLREKLESLDDLVFEAIAGKQAATEQLRNAWPGAVKLLPRELLVETREHYIRHALDAWKACVDGDRIRNPELATNAVEVIEFFLNESL